MEEEICAEMRSARWMNGGYSPSGCWDHGVLNLTSYLKHANFTAVTLKDRRALVIVKMGNFLWLAVNRWDDVGSLHGKCSKEQCIPQLRSTPFSWGIQYQAQSVPCWIHSDLVEIYLQCFCYFFLLFWNTMRSLDACAPRPWTLHTLCSSQGKQQDSPTPFPFLPTMHHFHLITGSR